MISFSRLLQYWFCYHFFLIVILVLRFTGEGEIFYRQSRIGKNGQIIKVLKFATMLKNSPNMATGSLTVAHDPRVLPFGHFLRKTKINELPQLWNVLTGDMSLIGPRPLTQEAFSVYPKNVQKHILKSRPGISGLGSIIFRDEERFLARQQDPKSYYQTVIAPYKGALELWYSRNNNMLVYFSLIFLTIWVVVFPKSKLVWRVLPDLPEFPPTLSEYL